MKKRDITELHTKTEGELRTMLKELKAQVVEARLDHNLQKLTNTSSLTNMRADIARILTVLQMKTQDNSLRVMQSDQKVAEEKGGKA